MSAVPRRRSLAARRRRHGYLFVAPVFLFLCAIVVFPLGNAFWTSLQRVRGLRSTFVGLANYATVLTDSAFWHALWTSFLFTGIAVSLHMLLGLGLALLLNELTSTRFKRIVQTITYMPHFISLVVVVGMLIFMPTSIAQVQKRSVCGKVILNTTEAVALTEVYIYFPNADLIPAAGAEPDGTFCIETFVADLSKTRPAQLYVTSLCRPNDLTLVDVPYWSALRKEPRFSGKRIMVGPGNLTSVGSVDNQIVYGHVTLRILDQRQRALLTEKMDWSPLCW